MVICNPAMPLKSKTAAIKLEVVLTDALYKSIERFRRYRSLITFVGIRLLVHGQVTIIFVVSVCLSVCLFVQSFYQPSLIRFRSNLDTCYMSGSSCVP